MSHLGIAVVTSAVQVTLLALVATTWYARGRRRGPTVGSWLAAALLGVSGLLALLALCPLPSWWSWRTDPRLTAGAVERASVGSSNGGAAESTGIAEDRGEAGETSVQRPPRFALQWSAFGRWFSVIDREIAADAAASLGLRWSVVISAAFLLGSAICLIRLGVGLWAVRSFCRRSVLVNDPGHSVGASRASL